MKPSELSVLKFGGSCLRTHEDMKHASDIVLRYHQPVVVASAMNSVTQRLIDLCDSWQTPSGEAILEGIRSLHMDALSSIRNLEAREGASAELDRALDLLVTAVSEGSCSDERRAYVLSFGERFSSVIIKWYLLDSGLNASSVSSDEILFSRDDDYLNAIVDEDLSSSSIEKRVMEHISKGEIPVITGFYCRSKSGRTALLGRNSSDYTAAVVAYSLQTRELVFWKDVPGLMTGDPKLLKDSRVLNVLTYAEARRYIANGARVLHPKVLELSERKEVSIRVKNFRSPEEQGTFISKAVPSAEPS